MVLPNLKGRGWDFPLCSGLFSATVDECGLNQSQGMERLFILFCPLNHKGVRAIVERQPRLLSRRRNRGHSHQRVGQGLLGSVLYLPRFLLEPMAGIEPATDGLRNRCSTTE